MWSMAMDDQEFLVELGKVLAAKRRALGLSQADLAYRVGMEVPNLSVIENGKSNPQVLTIARICAALNVNVSDVMPEITNAVGFLENQGKYRPNRRKSGD